MLLTVSISCSLSLALTAYFFFVARRRVVIGPEGIFLVLNTGTYIATLHAASISGIATYPYCDFIGLGLISFVFGTAASILTWRFNHRRSQEIFLERPWIDDVRGAKLVFISATVLVALAVVGTYFYLLGFFVPHAALQAFLGSGSEEMATAYNALRRQTSATGTYLAAGYVFQFKNCLLPLATIITYFKLRKTPRLATSFVLVFLAVMTVLATIGTGARFALAFFVGSFLIISCSHLARPFRLTGRLAVLIGVALLLALSLLTLMMGSRGREKETDIPLLWSVYQVLDRVVVSPAEERLQIFDLFLQYEEPQMGRIALENLRILLPGRQEDTLANQMHELLYGSATGNAGPDFWGLIWYDFQWFGLLISFFVGFLFNSYYIATLRGPKRMTRVVTLLFAGLILGSATDLLVLILRGFLTCMLFLGLANLAGIIPKLLRPSARFSSGTLAERGNPCR